MSSQSFPRCAAYRWGGWLFQFPSSFSGGRTYTSICEIPGRKGGPDVPIWLQLTACGSAGRLQDCHRPAWEGELSCDLLRCVVIRWLNSLMIGEQRFLGRNTISNTGAQQRDLTNNGDRRGASCGWRGGGGWEEGGGRRFPCPTLSWRPRGAGQGAGGAGHPENSEESG